MSREIKFRCWNNREMLYWDFNSAYKIFKQINSFPIPFEPLMQYTGLKDRNGVEIYEGDIIRFKYFKGFSGIQKEVITEVKFVDGCFGFYEHQDYFNRYDLTDTEVIGNIFETPELIKEVKHE